jgi:hypothetical protein
MNLILVRKISRAQRLASPSVILLLFWLFAFAHYGYRYILGYGGPFAVAGYTPTPIAFQILKDIALATLLLLALALVLKRRGGTGISRWYFPVATLAAAALATGLVASLWNAARGEPLGTTLLFGFRYPWLYTVMLVLAPVFVPPESVKRFLFRFADLALWMSLPYWLVQVALYYAVGRLPWNAYPGSPRFGGIMDDPNGYGIFCVFLFAILLSGRVRFKTFKLAALTVMILMTFSLSAYGALGLFGGLVLLRHLLVKVVRVKRVRARVAFPLLTGALALLAGALVYLASPAAAAHAAHAARWWEGKLPSVLLHLEDFFASSAQVVGAAPDDFLFGDASSFSENYYLYLWQNSGLAGILLLLALVAPLLWLALTATTPLYRNVGLFALTILIAANVIPYLQVYPINLYFWSSLGLTAHALLGRTALSAPSAELAPRIRRDLLNR